MAKSKFKLDFIRHVSSKKKWETNLNLPSTSLFRRRYGCSGCLAIHDFNVL